eukprot:jgi/Mesen1/10559/ME000843S10070
MYVLRSILPAALRRKHVDTPGSCHLKGLALVIMSLINASGEKLEERQLWSFLNRIGVREEDERHPTFGNVRQAMQRLEKQRYFHSYKVTKPEGDAEIFYELAEGGLDQLSSKKLSKLVRQTIARAAS